ncbi:bifunctional 3-(3-hydroxy-phenyl)propionate/3-hydroxycinnamic acid hydroxylase [Nocardia jiangxiensis]|uniref:bifunctional 3-(3-hydroxy-phenyl)propionate/3-hydroxycinnamic acid hydroxylase n=1 Tax=Nocardia jiangxiensis TaxID=282685 RepID=UPI0002DE7D65|nr:bifunctional 3-(3-hydroxy-phenyl)propionate/3-hydroxycinnamic acid hydroxylase [Nocardia jiangxiensis]
MLNNALEEASVVDYQVDVAVVGSGPCGVTLANLLGRQGVRTVVVDREPDVVDHPRAVAVDDESLRSFQAAGLAPAVLADCIQNAPIRYYNSRGKQLAHVRPSGQPYGWPRRNLFFQPLMEATLRTGLERFDQVELLTGTEVTDLRQHADRVELTAKSDNGEVHISAAFVVGADGGRSFVREAAGLALVGATAPSKWLVVDVSDDTLDAPFSAVYCDPDRPAMTIPLPYGYRRFEFKLLPDESEDDIVRDDSVDRLVRRFYTDRPMPKILRRRVYWHHSRTADRFQNRRVFVAGDAAHLQPPFFGQGMNSGIRDATNLAWKLAAVTSGRADRSLLDSYDAERRGHAETMVSFATRLGGYYQPRNRATEVIRDALFRGVQLIPGAREYILQMKYKPTPRYTDGVVVDGHTRDVSSQVGRLFGQPFVQTTNGERCKLDDAVGSAIAVLGLTADPVEHLAPQNMRRLDALGARLFHVTPPRTARRFGFAEPTDVDGHPTPTTILYDIDGAFRDMLLARKADEVLILRPDRYVAAACRADELDRVVGRFAALLDGGQHG